MPLVLLHAVLGAEDHRFFEHGGVDLRGLLRAVWVNLRAGRVTQGGSTITQQLVKNRLLGSQRTFGRKLREAWLAAVLEWRYTKEQILEAYLNEAYLGQRGSLAIRGVGSAARAYFRKEVHQLTLAEAALLAGMVRAPNSYSPVLNPDRARQRRDVVLARMRSLGRISEVEYQTARQEPIRLQSAPAPGQSAPYFADYVRQEIEHRLGDGIIDARGGARVFTSLDLALQRLAEAAVKRGLEHSLNAATGRIAQEIGLGAVIERARALGIASPLSPVPAMALGAFEVTPLELARAYLPFANGGVRAETVTSVRAVWEDDGGAVALPEPELQQAVPTAEAYLMTSLLQGVIVSGTGASARTLGVAGPVAGKTGTTNDGRDAWFVGYAPNLLALVWVGFDSGEPHGLSGAQAALPIWADFMRQALEAYPAPDFDVPPGVTRVDIDLTNGRTANRFCPVVVRETFLEGTAPPPCQEHGGMGEQIVDWWRKFFHWLRR